MSCAYLIVIIRNIAGPAVLTDRGDASPVPTWLVLVIAKNQISHVQTRRIGVPRKIARDLAHPQMRALATRHESLQGRYRSTILILVTIGGIVKGNGLTLVIKLNLEFVVGERCWGRR